MSVYMLVANEIHIVHISISISGNGQNPCVEVPILGVPISPY